MPRSPTSRPAVPASEVVSFRLGAELYRRLENEARRRRISKTDVVRSILSAHLQTPVQDLATEARRQSLLANAIDRKDDLAALIDTVHDDRGWR